MANAQAVNQTRTTLDRIIRTYEWQQYRFQALSCRNVPSFYTDCSSFFPGDDIPIISDVQSSVFDNSQDPQVYFYSFLRVPFYGFSRANYTTIEPALINITAQALYHYCQNNATCAQAYANTTGIQQSLLSVLQQNSGKIKASLPSSNSETWVPTVNYANALSYFTVLPAPGSEIYGLHNGVLYMTNQLSTTQAYSLYALQQRLNGGAEMLESLINYVALVGLDAYGNTTTYSKREATDVSILGGESQLDSLREYRNKIMTDLSRVRGRGRLAISSLNMASNRAFLTSTQSLGQKNKRATCSRTTSVQNYATEVNAQVGPSCSTTGIFDVSTTVDFTSGPFYAAGSLLGLNATNNHIAAVAFVNAAVALLPSNGPAYPGPKFWSSLSSSNATLPTYLKGAFSANKIGQNGYVSLSCVTAPLAAQYYNLSVACCQSNCNSVTCSAGSVACAIGGPAC